MKQLYINLLPLLLLAPALYSQDSEPLDSFTENITDADSLLVSGSTIDTMITVPVELSKFSGNNYFGSVTLEWTTKSETNNEYFSVMRSQNGKDFEVIGTVPGAGTSVSPMEYSFADATPNSGMNYYRLKQTDYDGNYSYSNIIRINNLTGNGMLNIFPNPVRNQNISVEIQGFGECEEVLIVVMNTMGETFFSKVVITDDNGYTMTSVDPCKQIPSKGIYIITGSSENAFHKRTIVIE